MLPPDEEGLVYVWDVGYWPSAINGMPRGCVMIIQFATSSILKQQAESYGSPVANSAMFRDLSGVQPSGFRAPCHKCTVQLRPVSRIVAIHHDVISVRLSDLSTHCNFRKKPVSLRRVISLCSVGRLPVGTPWPSSSRLKGPKGSCSTGSHVIQEPNSFRVPHYR